MTFRDYRSCDVMEGRILPLLGVICGVEERSGLPKNEVVNRVKTIEIAAAILLIKF